MHTGRPRYWSLNRILETAEKCRTWREFYEECPHAYSAAVEHDLLDVVRSHCGWEKVNGVVQDTEASPPLPLKDVIEDHGSLLLHAFDDPKWPMDTRAEPLKEEIL